MILYYIPLGCILFILVVGGGGAQNDGYARLEKLIELEKQDQLEQAKKNPQNDDKDFEMDLKQFKNSSE